MLMLKNIILLLVISFAGTCLATIREEPVPGGVALVPIEHAAQYGNPPVAFFEKQRLTVVPMGDKPGKWMAVVGIPLGQKTGTNYISVQNPQREISIPFVVYKKAYPSEHVKVAQKYVTPPKSVLNRIQDEAKQLNWVLSQWHPNNSIDLKLIKPVEGRVSSEFGIHRILNGQPRSYHKGVDFAAPIGTPVKATQSGVIVEKGDYYYTGNTIVVDHGQTFKTIYCHLDTINVEKGQKVQLGEQIGTVGKTGRASGPHLHFGASLNNARVSPELFF